MGQERPDRLRRVLTILQRLFGGEIVHTRVLAEEFLPNSRYGIRTIQKDFKVLNEYLGDVIQKGAERGSWRLADRYARAAVSLDDDEKVVLLFGLDATEPSEHLNRIGRRIERKLLEGDEDVPLCFKAEGLEDLNLEDTDIRILQEAIEHRRMVEFADEKGDYIFVEPFKIVNMEGIWYLFGRKKNGEKPHEKGKLDLWMLSQIGPVTEVPEPVFLDEKERETIETILEKEVHSPFYEEGRNFDVRVRISAGIAHYFKKKTFLRTQEIEKEESDGSLIVRFKVTNDQDVDNLIKRWLPDIEVVEPVRFRRRIQKELQAYLDRMGRSL
jgi:predicted DNA-binding transcriptional regulator YafY